MDSQQKAQAEHENSEHKDHVVIVSVNEQPVKLHGHEATGAQINTVTAR